MFQASYCLFNSNGVNYSAQAGSGGVKTLYQILEVDPKADEKQIKEAFFKKAKKIHPGKL